MLVYKENDVLIDAIGKIVGSRLYKGKIEFKLKIDNQYIWLSSEKIKTLPTEEDLK